MYDSRNIRVPKKLTKANILELVSESYIIRHYMGFDFKLGKAYSSPLREDSNPSFVLYMAGNGSIKFKDFNGLSGNCFDLVMHIHNVDFKEALSIIDKDLGLKLSHTSAYPSSSPKRVVYNVEKQENRKKLIQFKPQVFTKFDLDYWAAYNINAETLNKYNVYSGKFIFLDKKLILRYAYTQPIFCYKFPSGSVKVYRPLNTDIKWLSNTTELDIQGETQLPEKVDCLIITKSLKDVMVLDSLGYSAIAPQSENTKTQYEKMVEIIKSKQVKFITIIFDNDQSGRNGAQELNEYLRSEFDSIITIDVLFVERQKDISDLIKAEGEGSAVEFLKNVKCQK